jgi:hypothetical protein
MAVTGAWKRQTQTQRDPQLHNPIDPAHLTPTDQEQIFWEDTSGQLAPGMPADVEGTEENIGTPTTHGYIDTTPQGGDFGMPAFPGFTIEEGQAVRGVAHSQDFGAFAARKYVSPPNRDGSLNIDDFSAPNFQGTESDQNTIRYETGVEAESDFGANRHRKIRRWRDRFIDFHWYAVEMNPSYQKYATPAVTKPEVTNARNQAMSPYSAGDILYDGGSFTLPMERRTPEPWDTDLIQPGIPVPGADFGLGQWGL